MSKIIFEKSDLLSFLKQITLKGEIENKEALLSVGEKTIVTKVVSADRSLALRGELKGDFENVGDVGIDNLPLFVQLVTTLGNEIKVDFVKNKVTFQSSKSKLTTVLRAADYIVNKLEDEKFNNVFNSTQKGLSFALPKETVKDIVSKFKLLGGNQLTLSSDGKTLSLKGDCDETEMVTDYEIETKGEFSLKLSKFIIDLFDIIGDNVNISMAKEEPRAITVSSQGKNWKFEYLVAVLQEEKEESDTSAKKKIKVKA